MALDLVTTLFSQLCALFQSRSLFHVMTQLKLKERELFNLPVVQLLCKNVLLEIDIPPKKRVTISLIVLILGQACLRTNDRF